MCIQTGKTMSDAHRMRFATDQFYFKTAEEMAQVFGELPEALERTVAIAERCNLRIEPVRNSFPEFKVPEGHTIDSYFERVARERDLRNECRDSKTLAKQGRLAPAARRIRAAPLQRNQDDQADALRRLLPDRLGLHPLLARPEYSGRPGPRFGRRKPGQLRAAHHRRRPAAIRPALRALPQSRARFHARYRHRLLHAPPRRSDRLRHGKIWPRQRRPDHHLRHHGRQGRAQGRRPRAWTCPTATSIAWPSWCPTSSTSAWTMRSSNPPSCAPPSKATSASATCWRSPSAWKAWRATPPRTPPAW